MARPYRTKRLNAARSALLGVLQARASKMEASLPPGVAVLVDTIRSGLEGREAIFRERKTSKGVVFRGCLGTDALHAFFDRYPFWLSVTDRRVSSCVMLPGHVPDDTRMSTADFLCRVNRTIVWGGFKFDMGDGMVSYELSLPNGAFAGGDFNEELDRLVCLPIFAFCGISRQLAMVMLGKLSPSDAMKELPFDECECPDDDDCDDDEHDCDTWDRDDVIASAPGSAVSASAKPTSASAAGNDLPSDYDTDVLNVVSNVPVEQIVAGAKRFLAGVRVQGLDAPRFSILLSGPPGGGKSSFARHLAHQVGKPLMEKRGSDILSCYVGQTEKNIVATFKEAAENHAVLLLDEIDALLWSRAAATHSWEASGVNELLGQLEKASCIVIGATNFEARLDAAVTRRFTFKVNLDYLTDGGKATLFERLFRRPLDKNQRARLDAMTNLCPGDFRVALEQLFYVREAPSVDDYLDALEKESESKGASGHRRIGF